MSSGYIALVASGLLTGVLSVLFGGISGWLAGREKTRQALDAWRRSREDSIALSALKLIQELAQALASASHSAMWLTWRARYSPDRLTQDDINRYDYEVHELLPKILGMQTALRAVSAEAAEQLESAIGGYARLDGMIGFEALKFGSGDSKALAGLHDRTLEYQSELESAFRNAASNLVRINH